MFFFSVFVTKYNGIVEFLMLAIECLKIPFHKSQLLNRVSERKKFKM